MTRRLPLAHDYDPDPIVEVLAILSALANLASIGSFARDPLSKDRGRRRSKSAVLRLTEKNAAARIQIQTIERIYSLIRDTRESTTEPLGFAPRTGLYVGAKLSVRPRDFPGMNRLRKQLFRKIATLEIIVTDIMEILQNAGLSGETPYTLYESLRDSINDLLQDRNRSLDVIEADLMRLLAEADSICTHVGHWLDNYPP